MKFSMTGQEKGDLLIQVTTWVGLTVYVWYISFCRERKDYQMGIRKTYFVHASQLKENIV